MNARSKFASGRKGRLPSVSRSLQALAIVVLLVFVVAAIHQLGAVRNAIISDTERQMYRLDMVFAEQTVRTIETVDVVLRSVVEAQEAAPAALDAVLERRIRGVAQIKALALADSIGKVYATTQQTHPAMIPPAGMALLEQYKAHPQKKLLFSAPFRDADNNWTSLMSCPIISASGTIEGVALAYLNLRFFENFYRSVELSENGSIILHLRDGTVLARYPHVDSAIGTSFGDLPPFTEVLAHKMAGTLLMESPIDGSIRITAIRALKGFPLAVMISVEEGRLLVGWRRDAMVLVIAAVLAGSVIIGLLLLLARQSRQVETLLGNAQEARATVEQANKQLREEMSERERAESALRQSQRIEAIGQLTGGVAHDFNNLLTVVLCNVELLQRKKSFDQPDSAERLAAIRAAANRGATLTGHLLAFARRQPLQPKAVDLNAVVEGMRDLMDSALGSKVRLALQLAPDLSPAMVDQTQIELVILNLVINARDAMPDGGSVTIETRNQPATETARKDGKEASRFVAIIVRDTGTGMTPEVKAKAFEPFFTTKAPGAGSGLGLSQVFGTARQSGGEVQIDTELGKGTAVCVLLPRATPATLDRPAADTQEGQGSGATVLLVDDDEPVRVVTAAVLRDLGYSVREATSGAEALDTLRHDVGIDVLLTDLAMPDMNGAQLAEAAQARRPDLAVVFVSGYADPESITRGTTLRRLVRKPFRPGELRQQIEAALNDRG